MGGGQAGRGQAPLQYDDCLPPTPDWCENLNGLLHGLADEICGKLNDEVTGVVTEYLSTLEKFGSAVNSLIVLVLL